MRVTTALDFRRVPAGQPFTVRLLVSAFGETPAQAERPPLALALVLDRSGSMAGAKLEQVKAAALLFARRLGKDDLLSLTTFDHKVATPFPPARVSENFPEFETVVSGIRKGGRTFLSGGYDAGCLQARRGVDTGRRSRVILLTDG